MSNVKCQIFAALVFLFLAFPAQALAATLSLSPSSGTFNKGCLLTLEIVLDTQSADTDGTDAILKYDTSRFTATSVDTELTPKIYSDYPGTNIDEATGKITVSGLASVATPYKGKGTLAKINLTVKDTAQGGATQITFDFDPNDKTKTTDSNVVERGTVADVLSSVVNGSYTIGTGSCVAPSPSPAPGVSGPGKGAPGVSTPSATPSTIDDLVGGQPGTPALTLTITIVGVILTVLGILGLAFL